jgi:hypothetical protein
MSRPNLKPALLLSLVLHVLLGVWMVTRPTPFPAPPPERPLQVTFETVTAPPPPAPPKPVEPEPAPKKPLEPVRPAAKLATREPPPSAAQEAPSAPVDDVPRAEGPRAEAPTAAPGPAPILFPSQLGVAENGTFEVAPRRGETVRPDDPRFSKEVLNAQAEQRVKARVTDWAEDTLAEARAQRGLPHPYFSGVRDAARAGLDKLAAQKGVRASFAQAAGAMAGRYLEGASSYGKGGDPNLGPPGQAPQLSEKLNQPEQQAMRGLAQATETFNALSHGKPLLSLTLELRQSKDKKTRTAVLKGSSDPAFDAFVLEAWPTAISAAGPPPEDAFRSDELRSIWEIEGWPGSTKLDKALTYLPDPGVLGIPLTKVIPGAVGGYSYEFRARLLRVY